MLEFIIIQSNKRQNARIIIELLFCYVISTAWKYLPICWGFVAANLWIQFNTNMYFQKVC